MRPPATYTANRSSPRPYITQRYTPYEMVFGRAPQQLSPSHLYVTNFRKSHPRAKAYMEALAVGHLEVAKKEVDRAATIPYIESWPMRKMR